MPESRGSGCSLPFWLKDHSLNALAPLKEDLTADVCIVGGGIAGLTAAYILSLNKIDTILLEDGLIGGGETSRTTGHLTNALDDHYYELERIFGENGARLARESHAAAIDFIETLVKKEKIDCGFSRLDAFLFLAPGEPIETLKKELKAVLKAGITEAEIISNSPLKSFNTGPCLRFPKQAEFSPLPYLNALVGLIQRQGGRIFTGTHVDSFAQDSLHIVKTSGGRQVRAKSLIIATNGPIYDRLTIHTKQAAYRTYVIAGKVPKDYVSRGLYYDTLDPYHYIRTVSSSFTEDYLIIGGEDHRTGQDDHPEHRYLLLENWSRERFPLLGKIEYKWSGQIMEPVDCMGFIGQHPGKENVYVVTGDSGNGLTHGTIAGILISDLICGRSNPWKELYDPSRKTLATLSDFVQENANTFVQYADWVTQNEKNSLEEIPCGSGKILSTGIGKKIAVYRDNSGELHTVSAVCPHLGGVVRWNPGEKSWDCPCHGSRFDCYGKVLHGPAIHNLKKEKNPSGD